MKLTFVSNYINHHQIPLAEELFAVLGEDYHFIETEPMEKERIAMGWNSHTDSLPYLMKYYQQPESCQSLIEESDIVVFGGTDEETYIKSRLAAHKPVIRCSERLYKEGQWKAVSPRGLRKKYQDHTRYRREQVYLLCAGAYVPADFHIVRAYPGKMFRWGYFPPFVVQDVDKLMKEKKKNSVPMVLWTGRFIDWKHPQEAVLLAEQLKKEGLSFRLVMVGGGEQKEELESMIREKELEDVTQLTGFLTPEEIRQYMEEAAIFLFTSDYKEGWGAVLNEAMNSGCGVVANAAAGAAPYLIKHNQNGLLYPNEGREQLISHVRRLLTVEGLSERLGRNAYRTIEETWNAKKAGEALLLLCERILGREDAVLPKTGPGSPAEVVSQRGMYKRCTKGEQP